MSGGSVLYLDSHETERTLGGEALTDARKIERGGEKGGGEGGGGGGGGKI
jgi:hypothetical protein